MIETDGQIIVHALLFMQKNMRKQHEENPLSPADKARLDAIPRILDTFNLRNLKKPQLSEASIG